MKGKSKWLVVLASLFITGAVTAASSRLYMGKYPIANVVVNGAMQNAADIPPIMLGNTIMVSLRGFSDKLGAFVHYNQASGETSVVRPDVNMIMAGEITKTASGSYQLNSPFMAVTKGKNASFDIFAEISNTPKTSNLTFKVIVISPSGGEEYISYPQSYSSNLNGTAFLYTHNVKGMQFNEAGDYKVQLIMKQEATGDYIVVGQNIIHSQ
ncbi:hypothetical protein PP175_17150 [Aneurinibacillus sp. Ricciae_BoGa-3]|uniref:hypothetical protein n=1 Tax=Aneurinibacillus sp. Ricciae_BoGa-3 TaxID=3022697 RepID=UPI002342261F|nr:hypothetical protein [Aneurinibacillus sp. Ricciae_BoGa-3]WCK53126.1 hypothetical protein PP175_17150 [Aneurinibacillus sp. Ricciae_BoGa-3]